MSVVHRIPDRTVKLGTALVLVTQEGDRVTTWDEVAGWNLLTTVDAIDQARARLFIVPGKLRASTSSPHGRGARTYDRWHDREPAKVGELRTPDELGVKVGRALRIDYRSDKWGARGRTHDYTHDFYEDGGRPPLVYVDDRKRPRGFVLSGGSMTVSERGIA